MCSDDRHAGGLFLWSRGAAQEGSTNPPSCAVLRRTARAGLFLWWAVSASATEQLSLSRRDNGNCGRCSHVGTYVGSRFP